MEFALVLMSLALLGLTGLVAYLLIFGRAPRRQAIEAGPGSVESIRSVGELVVLRAIFSAPAIGRESIWGVSGRKFLDWLWSESKSIMVFRFEISFKYDVRDAAAVKLKRSDDRTLVVELGKPAYDVSIRDISFFHTEQGRLLDWLLPKALGLFQSNMDDETRQQMLEAAHQEAIEQAEAMVDSLSEDARLSAEATLRGLAHGMGFDRVIVARDGAKAAA